MLHESAPERRSTRECADLTLVATGREARPVWDELCEGPWVQATQTPRWLDCMCEVMPFVDASRLYEAPQGRHVLLPLVRHRRAPVECSLPHPWDYAGPLATGGIRPADIAGVLGDLRSRRRALRTTVRAIQSGEASRAWGAAFERPGQFETLPSHVIDLSNGFEDVWSRKFTSKVRSASRKALRRGVRIESDTSGRLVPVFADLYRKSIDRWASERGEPIRLRRLLAARYAPAAAFAAAAARMGDGCRAFVAFHDGHPVAGLIAIRHGDQVTYWKGAMDKTRIAGTGANELLHRRAVEWACELGARSYHMGPHVDRYKRTFGTAEVDAVEARFELLPFGAIGRAARGVVKRTLARRGSSSAGSR